MRFVKIQIGGNLNTCRRCEYLYIRSLENLDMKIPCCRLFKESLGIDKKTGYPYRCEACINADVKGENYEHKSIAKT